MPWQEVSTMQLRSEFVVLAEQGGHIRQLCRRFGINPSTAYKWLERHRQGASLEAHSRRPLHSPARSSEAGGRAGPKKMPTPIPLARLSQNDLSCCFSITARYFLRGWIKDAQFPEITSVKSAITGQEPAALDHCVCADQKIGRNSLSLAACCTVLTPGTRGSERALLRDVRKRDPKDLHRIQECALASKRLGGFGPDDRAGGN
jgi:transposase-like protein